MQNETNQEDRAAQPFVVIWEPTRACDLACLTCRAAAQPLRSRFELSTYESYKLVDQIVALQPERFIITGGDPLKRSDLFQLVDYASRRNLPPTLAPSATPLLSTAVIDRLAAAGLGRLAMSIDGATAASHDGYRGVEGSFDLTLKSLRYAREIGIEIEVNSTIARHNFQEVEDLVRLVEELGVVNWNLFLLVPTGRGKERTMINAAEAEELFQRIYQTSLRTSFTVDTVEGMHYRRLLIEKEIEKEGISMDDLVASGKGPRGVVFVSHTGEVYPSGFLPLSGGNVHYESLRDIYRKSSIFTSLRDVSLLKGRCGACEYQEVCGGSRARAYAITGDPLEADPLCGYVPEGYDETAQRSGGVLHPA